MRDLAAQHARSAPNWLGLEQAIERTPHLQPAIAAIAHYIAAM